VFKWLDALLGFGGTAKAAAPEGNPLAGLALDYLIGAENVRARRGRIAEVPYNAPHPGGLAIGYCNLFDETNSGQFGPYLKTSDTAKQYNEGQIDPEGDGWARNLAVQFNLRRSQGFEYIELDNPDAYYVGDVSAAVAMAGRYGLKVIAKNPAIMDGDCTQYVKMCHGIIVERDCGTAKVYDNIRRRISKPTMPVWFVYHGAGKLAAKKMENAIRAGDFKNMSVTYSAKGEYGDSWDILLPVRA